MVYNIYDLNLKRLAMKDKIKGKIQFSVTLEIERDLQETALEKNVSVASVARDIFMLGLAYDHLSLAKTSVETLCLLRRLVADKDMELFNLGREDAEVAMEAIGLIPKKGREE